MVEVFKTNVDCHEQAVLIMETLLKRFPQTKINFDLEDSDRILRIKGKTIVPDEIIKVLNYSGYLCSLLEENK